MRRMKRWLSIVLCLVMVLGLLPATALADGPDSGSGELSKETECTRARLAELIYADESLKALIGSNTADAGFSDIGSGTSVTEAQRDAINALANAGIVSGTSPTTFSPSKTVTRAEVAVVFWRATGCKSNPTAVEKSPYSDVMGTEPYGPAVLALTAMGIIQGNGTGAFEPMGKISEYEVGVLISRYQNATDTTSWGTGVTRLEMLMEVYQQYKDNPILKAKAEQGIKKEFTDIGSCTSEEQAVIEFFTKAGIIQGVNTTPPMFQPYAPASSFQIAMLLQRCATASESSTTESQSVMLNSEIMLLSDSLQDKINEAFQFLANQGITIDEAIKENPHAPGLSDNLTTWTKSVAPEQPIFDKTSGTYVGTQSVTVSAGAENDGTVIYYTVNGGKPTASSTKYSEAITITETTTLKAIAVKNNLVSDVAEATYTIVDQNQILSALSLSDGSNNISLTPTFASITWAYTAEVGSDVANVTVTPTVAGDGSAAITVNGESVTSGEVSQTIALAVGENTITVTVTSGESESTTYTITITKTNIHSITFNAAGGSVTPVSAQTTAEGKLNSLPVPTRTDYRFEGWYTMPSGGNLVTTDTVFNEDCEIYAVWTYVGGSSGGSSGGGSSSGSGSGSTSGVTGSGDDVSVSVSGGSVTTSQMESAVKKADEGAPITIEADSASGVSLPAGGLADAADNGNDLVVELRYGEIIVSARAAAGLTDGISSKEKVEISVTRQRSSDEEELAGLLERGVVLFDVSVEAGGTSVHSFDGTLTLTFTVPNLEEIDDPHVLHILADGSREYYTPDRISGNTITVRGIRNLSTFAVIPGSEIPVEPVNPFVDVDESDYYYDAVLWAVANGITNGTTPDGTLYSPDLVLSRAQMVTFLWRVNGAPRVTGSSPFTDVNVGDYYYDAVLWAVANGVTTGTTSTTFSPDLPVTRAQAVTFQWRAAGAPLVSGGSFVDVPADAWYANAVAWAVANGITNGTGGGIFNPDMEVSRAQAVTFLYREQQ